MRRLHSGLIVLLGFIGLAEASHADLLPANGADTAANFAEISLLKDRVQVDLEIDFKDLPAFVSPAAPGVDPAAGLSDRLGQTLHITADGIDLPPELQSVEIRDRKQRAAAYRPTNNLIQPQQLSGQVIHAVLSYPFEGRPAKITLTPPMESRDLPAATLGFLADHSGVPVTDYRYLSRAETLRPNWEDPWFSTFDNPNLTRHHKSALMSFLQVQPREVRHEVIFRLKDLETWADLDLGDATTLDAATMQRVILAAEKVFSRHNPLTIDGVSVLPTDAKVNQLSVGVEGLKVLEIPESTDRLSALLGIVLSYPQPTLPDQIEMTWTLFTNDTQTVPVKISDPTGGVPGQVSVSAPTSTWKNYIVSWEDPATAPIMVDTAKNLSIPHISLALLALSIVAGVFAMKGRSRQVMIPLVASACTAAAFLLPSKIDVRVPNPGTPAPQMTTAILSGVLENMDTAMLETQEIDFLSALQPFVTLEAARDVGAEMNRGLSVSLPSGAQAQTETINAIKVEEVTRTNDGHRILASWNAIVSGGHWGHQHRRAIEFRALVDVTEEHGAWKLNGLTILQARTPTIIPAPEANS